ncbi:MAG: tRNA (adenosine(37)-N6)-dimethylallyltransferase MiaA [Pseudomonadota bacterium]
MYDKIAKCDPNRPVLISGPTASGKSGLAVALAEEQGREVVNADALQVFDGWRILTARPNDGDLQRAHHKLYGHVHWSASYSVGDWLREVQPLLSRRPAPVIVGGTGLYFQALLRGLAEIPQTDPDIRRLASERLAELGLGAMVAELDPGTRGSIDIQNSMRVQRAWEVLTQTGRGLVEWQSETPPPLLNRDRVDAFVVVWPTEVLNARIDTRFDQMIAQGAMREAMAMEPTWSQDFQSSRAIGAQQLIDTVRNIIPLNDAIVSAKQTSRQYAKRQRTWMRNKMQDWQALVTDR